MPFKSKSQMRWMFATHPKMAKKWASHTKSVKDLPDKKESAMKLGSAWKKLHEMLMGPPDDEEFDLEFPDYKEPEEDRWAGCWEPEDKVEMPRDDKKRGK